MGFAVSSKAVLGAVCLAASQTLFGDTFDPVTLSSFLPGRACRCFPGEPCWPSNNDWDRLNQTVNGKLIATVPIASPCHDTFEGVAFNATECARIQEAWVIPEFHVETAHSPQAAFFSNESCDPFSHRSSPCEVGSYVAYAVAAAGASDYLSTMEFARKHNLRLVIRNTGHDYMGKSTGAGALALWTHNIKEHAIIDYTSPAYTGKAMKVGAGVQAAEAQATANAQGYVIVEGDCPTVGIAGGYTQGGGASPLASKFGLAADQVLEWEVVTADGRLLTATPDKNSDLYWALSGGGGGTYGATLSMTVKLHPDMKTAGAALSFQVESDVYWDILRCFMVNLPAILEAGGTVYWMALPGHIFAAPQIYLPGGTAQQIEALLTPVFNALNNAEIPFQFVANDYDDFLGAYQALNPRMDVVEVNLGGRLVPRSLVQSEKSAGELTQAIKFIIESGAIFAGVSLNAEKEPASPNSVLPAWRETVFLAFFGIPYDRTNYQANVAAQRIVTEQLVPALEEITPGGGAYLNEADVNQPNWQQVFYGSNYARLLEIKKKYDPDGMFWGPTAVGSEKWQVVEGGRLCQ
ncbi:FAD binding domain protein [Stachybotrys elegans]|uniref:FAD binding domain protein n=1 Tax=Stachybotrys elegans TaxID=80388 RepID=A0A8K0WV42_9HYPO|nr:FAD binding domain protein [Stachybotrys elegans]